MDDWDPMKEAYENKNFNTYNEGVGRDLSVTGSRDEGVSLYVTNVPVSLGSRGLYNLFAEYGHVLNCKLLNHKDSDTKGYGFVNMANMLEAETAIRKLDKKRIGQLVLKVSPSVTEEERNKRKRYKQEEIEFMEAIKRNAAERERILKAAYLSSECQENRPIAQMEPSGDFQSSSGLVQERNYRNYKGSYTGPVQGRHMQGHTRDEHFNHTGGSLIDQAPIDLPPKCDLAVKLKECIYCRKQGCVSMCSQCKMFYCSSECQKSDWSRHRDICITVRDLINKIPGKANTTFGNSDPLRQAQKSYSSRPSDGGTEKPQEDNVKFKSDTRVERSQANNGTIFNSSMTKGCKTLPTDRNHKEPSSGNVTSPEKTPATLYPVLEMPLSISPSGQCLITHYENPNKFYILLQEYMDEFSENLEKLENNMSKSCETPGVLTVGGSYCVQVMNEWCRVKIVSVQDKDVSVYFWDYGNQSTVRKEDLRTLPYEASLLPAQAVSCCLSNVKPKGAAGSWSVAACSVARNWLGPTMSKILSYELVAKRGSVHAVDLTLNDGSLKDVLISGGFAESVNNNPGLPKLPDSRPQRYMASSLTNKMKTISSGSLLSVNITEIQSAHRFYVMDVNSLPVLQPIMVLLNSDIANSTQSYRPVKDELVVAKYSADQVWYRAEVVAIEKEQYKLFFVDYGNTECNRPEDIRPVTDKIVLELPKQALACKLRLDSPPTCNSDTLTQEFKNLMTELSCSEGSSLLMLVAGLEEEILTVDFVPKTGESISTRLAQRLNVKQSPPKLSSSVSKQSPPKCSSSVSKQSPPKSTSSAMKPSPPECSSSVLEKTAHVPAQMPAPTPVEAHDLGSETLAITENDQSVSVLVSYVDSAVEFYVRLTATQDLFQNMMKDLNRAVDKSPVLKPAVGCLAAVKHSTYHTWYRGIIKAQRGGRCVVRFIDNGWEEEVSPSNLRVLPPVARSLPAQAIKCYLENAPAGTYVSFKEDSVISLKVIGVNNGNFAVKVVPEEAECSPVLAKLRSPKATSTHVSPKKQEEVTKRVETLSSTDKPVLVKVTHIESCSTFFVSLCHKEPQLMELMIKLNASVESLPPVSRPVLGSLYAAKYNLDGFWYRVRIVELIDSNACGIHFIDYGNWEKESVSNLRELNPTLESLPAQAISCCLSGFDWTGLPDRSGDPSRGAAVVESLKQELTDKQVYANVVDYRNETWIVDLANEHGENVSKQFKPPQNERASNLADIKQIIPKEKEFDAIVMHFNSFSDFYCQKWDESVMQELNVLSKQLEEDVAKLPVDVQIQPDHHSLFTCQFEGSWYRCVVEKMKLPKVDIRYIDYGNCETVSVNQLKPLHPDRLLVPVRLLRCKLHGVTPIPEKCCGPAAEVHKIRLQTNKSHIVVENVEDQVLSVSLHILEGTQKFNVAELLLLDNLAQNTGFVGEKNGDRPQKQVTPPEFNDEQKLVLQKQIEELQKKLLQMSKISSSK